MTDDNLDDVQKAKKLYCPMCDKEYEGNPAEPHDCLIVGTSKHAGVLMKDFNIIWNAAIDAAAEHVDLSLPPINGDSIRKLKK